MVIPVKAKTSLFPVEFEGNYYVRILVPQIFHHLGIVGHEAARAGVNPRKQAGYAFPSRLLRWHCRAGPGKGR